MPEELKALATNRKAGFEYFLLERFEAGLSLQGSEIKSIRASGFYQGGTNWRTASRFFLEGLLDDTPEMLAGIYNFPLLENGGEGRRITVGIAELGGAVDPVDLAEFTARYPRLRVVEEAVDGAVPRSDPMGPDTEVALDWQWQAMV